MNSKCNLHRQTLDFFCEKCAEPICKQCTILGPHHTQMHAISSFHIAYERSINNINKKISTLREIFQPQVLKKISKLSQQIEQVKLIKKIVSGENQRYMVSMKDKLIKIYERNLHQLNHSKQEMYIKMTQINDLGHAYETMRDPVQVIASHKNIFEQIKELLHQTEVLFVKLPNHIKLPTQLSNLRLQIKQIQVLNQIIDGKIVTLHQIFQILKNEKKKITINDINNEYLLRQLNHSLEDIGEHYVCHFCGTPFNFSVCNTTCLCNKISIDIKKLQKSGYCQKQPDSTKFGTHRHFWGTPSRIQNFYRNMNDQSSFKVQLKAILLKLKTILNIKQISFERQIMKLQGQKSKQCQKIVLLYFLVEQCNLTEKQSHILMRVCQNMNEGFVEYTNLEQMLSELQI